MKIKNATIEDVFKDMVNGKSISEYYILIRTKFGDKNRVRSLQTMTIQNTNLKDLKIVLEKEDHCLVKIEEESE